MFPTPPLTRHLPWDASYNIRDVGGYATVDGAETYWHALVRADNLNRLTPQGCAALRDYGVRTIIDLRLAFELAMAPCPFAPGTDQDGAVTYLNLPMRAGANDAAVAAVDAAESLQAEYCLMLDHYRPGIATIMRAVARAPDGGVLVYCHAGKDRTGLVVAVLLALAGVPPTTIAADYALSDAYLQPLYAEWFRSAQDAAQRDRLAQQATSLPETMLAMLSYIDAQHGGVVAYLRASGVSKPELDRIRQRLRKEHGDRR